VHVNIIQIKYTNNFHRENKLTTHILQADYNLPKTHIYITHNIKNWPVG